MKTVLVVYIVISGHMTQVRIPQSDADTCAKAAPQIRAALNAVHAECKISGAKK